MEISAFHVFLQKMSVEQAVFSVARDTLAYTLLTEIYAAQTTYNVLPVLTAVHLWSDHPGQMLIPGVTELNMNFGLKNEAVMSKEALKTLWT